MPLYLRLLLTIVLYQATSGLAHYIHQRDPQERFLQTSPTNIPICEYIEPNNDHYQAETLTFGTPLKFSQVKLLHLRIFQSLCVQYFNFTVNSAASGNYIFVELIFLNFTSDLKYNPVLLAKNGSFPEVSFDQQGNVKDNADFGDYDGNILLDFLTKGYTNRKTYQFIQIPNNFSQGDMM